MNNEITKDSSKANDKDQAPAIAGCLHPLVRRIRKFWNSFKVGWNKVDKDNWFFFSCF